MIDYGIYSTLLYIIVFIPGSDYFSGLGRIPANHYVVKIHILPDFLHEVPSTYQNMEGRNSRT